MVVIEPTSLDSDLSELISGVDNITKWIESDIKERLKQNMIETSLSHVNDLI